MNLHGFYRKWLRFYLDFCDKYKKDPRNPDSLPGFINKLREKSQPEPFQKQAYHSVLVYYDLYAIRPGWLENQPVAELVKEKTASYVSGNKGLHEAWKPVYEKLGNEIKVRHYSPKTHKAYRNWVRKFQQFLKGKTPEVLEVEDVKGFLTFLAVEQKVSASSQNQAFNALLFFFRHVLGKEFGKVEGVVRAKRKPYIPVVLSRSEIDRVIRKLRYPYSLVVKFLYGCGLRLAECMNIRINNFNLDMGVLTIHDGKGKKDRTVPLPVTIMPEINRQFEVVRTLHRQELLGHSDLRTTMIYTHTVKSRTIKEMKSPLDL